MLVRLEESSRNIPTARVREKSEHWRFPYREVVVGNSIYDVADNKQEKKKKNPCVILIPARLSELI